MKYRSSVYWHEGLFLKPQHLQFFQNSVHTQIKDIYNNFIMYHFGVINYEVSKNDLAAGKVVFNRFSAIMPDGTFIDISENATLRPLKITPDMIKSDSIITVYIGLPIVSSNEPNITVDDKTALPTTLYTAEGYECNDENIGTNPQTLMIKKLNARVVINPEKFPNMEFMPVLKLVLANKQTTESISLEIHKDYIPPCISLKSNEELFLYVSNFNKLLVNYRNKLLMTLKYAGYVSEELSGKNVESVMMLRSINKYSSLLTTKINNPKVKPYDVYIDLLELSSELAAFFPKSDIFEHIEYDHYNMYETFYALVSRISKIAQIEEDSAYIKLSFTEKTDYMQEAVLTNEHLIKGQRMYLAVSCSTEIRDFVKIAEAGDHFKLTSSSLLKTRTRGLGVSEIRNIPQDLPVMHNSTIWFEIKHEENSECWNAIRNEQKIVLIYSKLHVPKFEATLYITCPKKRDK